MTEEKEKPWYQDGCLVLVLVLIALVAGPCIYLQSRPHADVRTSGRVELGLFAPTGFEVTLWHQNPGNIRKGQVSVWVTGQGVAPGAEYQTYSFEAWQPNQENALQFVFPLQNCDPSQPLTVKYLIESANCQPASARFIWQNGGWKD